MKSLLLLTKKNLKLLLRAKASALIVIFAPLLIILILGLSYNTSGPFGLRIGVYSTSFTEDVNSFMASLQEQEFKIVKYEASLNECVEDIKLGFVHTCINVPESLKVEGNTAKEITFYVDPSKINLVYMIQETLKTKFNFKAQQISQEITANILTKLSATKTTLGEKSSLLSSAKEKGLSASTSTESVRATLASLDLALPVNIYNVSVSNTTARITTASSKIEEAITKVSATNLTATEKAAIRALLEDANTKLTSASNNTNDSGSTSLTTIISSLETDLNSAKTKLSTASSTISTTSASLVTATAGLQESVASLDTVLVALNDVQSNLNSITVTDPATIASPLVTKIEKVSPDSTYLNYLFPALLVLVVMFTSLLLGTTLVLMEKNSPAFLRNFFLPLHKVTFIASTYLTTLVLILVQIVIILGVSLFFLHDSLTAIPTIFLILLLAASVFTFLGMGIGYLFTSEETGVLASISLGSILLFLSGVILPLESVSPWLRDLTFFNPYVIAEKLIREVFIFNSPLSMMWVDLLTLLGYVVVLFLLILIAESMLHHNIVNRFMRHHHRQVREKEKLNKTEV